MRGCRPTRQCKCGRAKGAGGWSWGRLWGWGVTLPRADPWLQKPVSGESLPSAPRQLPPAWVWTQRHGPFWFPWDAWSQALGALTETPQQSPTDGSIARERPPGTHAGDLGLGGLHILLEDGGVTATHQHPQGWA